MVRSGVSLEAIQPVPAGKKVISLLIKYSVSLFPFSGFPVAILSISLSSAQCNGIRFTAEIKWRRVSRSRLENSLDIKGELNTKAERRVLLKKLDETFYRFSTTQNILIKQKRMSNKATLREV